MEKERIAFKGSHPDSLYRVTGSAGKVGKLATALRLLRWPLALIITCLALTLFVYFLIPNNTMEMDAVNGTAWDVDIAEAGVGLRSHLKPKHRAPGNTTKKERNNTLPSPGTTVSTGSAKITEIDFNENKQTDLPEISTDLKESPQKNNLISPVYPERITPEVQYGNEKADTDGFRSGIPQVLRDIIVPEDSTIKPRITQSPEKPLTVFFKKENGIVPTTETKAKPNSDPADYEFVSYEKITEKTPRSTDAAEPTHLVVPDNVFVNRDDSPSESSTQIVIDDPDLKESNFTSGHSKLFGISVEDAEKMKSTTQNSIYNTKVSPTLPTWHDGDDATTKNYPETVNLDVLQCSSTRLEICRGVLPYDLTGAPLRLAGVDVSSLLPQVQQLLAANCSVRLQQFICVLLEPECSAPPYPPRMPCYNLCRTIVESCEEKIPSELSPVFNCNLYSSSNCVSARAPCAANELACNDGSCVPHVWACDGARDCPNGEDEDTICSTCNKYEYRCESGTCIVNQWVCDGFSDCPGGEDEAESTCEAFEGRSGRVREPEDVLRGIDEEAAESAPPPSIRRPGRVQAVHHAGEHDGSKELLITSDSNHPYKKNFTRRPPLSRLTPYSRSQHQQVFERNNAEQAIKVRLQNEDKLQNEEKSVVKVDPNFKADKVEDKSYVDFYDEFKKGTSSQQKGGRMSKNKGVVPGTDDAKSPTRLDKSLDNLELVIDGAAMMKKASAAAEVRVTNESSEDDEDFPSQNKGGNASPCPTGELRCVDGRCITLAQLCDGNVDCSDHTDEENCFA